MLGEYSDDSFSKALAVLLTLFLGAYFFGIYNNDMKINPPSGSDIGRAANLLGLLSIVSFIVVALDFTESVPYIESLLFGDKRRLIYSAIAGAAGIFMLSGGKMSVLPLNVSQSAQFFFVVIASPVVEGIFFRGVLDPTLRKTLAALRLPMPAILGMLLANVLFSYYHVAVYGLSVEMQFTALAFGIAMSIGVALTRSLGFEMGAHFLNNFIAFGGKI